jgi:hypothetical protein
MDLIKYHLYQDTTYKTLWLYVGTETKHPIFGDECSLEKFIGVDSRNLGIPRYEISNGTLHSILDGPYECALGHKARCPF